MEARKVRFGVLIAAAVALPSMGYLVGFTKAQAPEEEDWSAEIEVDLERLSPVLPGVAALQHGDELKLTDSEKAAVLKIVRQDAPELIAGMRNQWSRDLEHAKKLFSGDEIVSEYHGLLALRELEEDAYHKAEVKHYMHIFRALPRKKYEALRKRASGALVDNRTTRLFLVLDPANADTLRLSSRQRKQIRRLASYFVSVADQKLMASDKAYPTLPIEQAIERLRKSKTAPYLHFANQAEDYLDPLQQMQLRALAFERTYVPVP